MTVAPGCRPLPFTVGFGGWARSFLGEAGRRRRARQRSQTLPHPRQRSRRLLQRPFAPVRGLAWGLLIALGVGESLGSPPPVLQAVGDVQGEPKFAFRVSPPALSLVPTTDGTRLELAGFGDQQRQSGAPEVPSRTIRVAIPPGTTPRLEIVPGTDEVLPGVRPRPVSRRVGEVPGEADETAVDARAAQDRPAAGAQIRDERIEDREIYEGSRVFPEAIARLGEIGVLRDQRYVEVHLAPVRFDPRLGGLRVTRSFEVIVHFDGDTFARAEPVPDSRFEPVYRNAFVNYAQGTTFRIGALAPQAPAAASPAAPASGPLYRIRIRQNGVVRLDFTRMNGTGFTSQALSSWKLMNRGVEVPLRIQDVNANNLLDAGDWVQFYGQALDDEPKTVLNTDLPNTNNDIYEARDFTDENVYFLSVETGSRSRMPLRDVTPTNVRVPPTNFGAVSHQEVDSPTGWRPLGAADPWYWIPTLIAGGSPASRTDSVPLPGLASGTLPAEVLVKVRGITESDTVNPDHQSRVTLETSGALVLATNNDNGTFDGRTLYTHDFNWTYPGSGPGLTDPALVVLDALPVSGVSNQFILDWIEIRYRRSFQASGDTLTFDWPDGDAEFIVSGLTNSAPEVYEITGRVGATGVVSSVRLTGATVTGAGPFTIRFRVDNDPALPDGTSRRFVVAGAGAVSIPADPDFTTDTVSDLKNNANQADLIVIAHPTTLGAAGSAARTTLNNLLAYHQSKGITSKIAMIEDVQDEFNDGLPGPLAIKNFLRWVTSTTPGEGWADPKPAFVLLLGDGSYDYKAGTTNGSFIPTQIMFLDDPQLGYYASDNVMAAVSGGDQLADLVVARVPVRDDVEANTVFQKLLSYQQSPPAGNWRRHALLVSDRGHRDSQGIIDVSASLEFEATNDAAESYLKRPPHTDQKLRYFSDYCNINTQVCNTAQMKNDIRSAVNGNVVSDGASIMQFEGHGNFDIWSDDSIWIKTDTDSLTNGSSGAKYPWLLADDCLTGGFHTTATRSMGEDWLKRSGGGAMAVFSPSGLSFNFVGHAVTDVLWNDLFGPEKLRTIDVPVLDTLQMLCGQGSTEYCQSFILMGDPVTDLVFPAVGPAKNVAAVAGNARVDLSWTASSTTGATYDIYRTPDINSTPYTKANGAPVGGTAFADLGVVNATTYQYYVVALDSQGFESRWSNFNSDCAVNGPDCVKATPLNPNPPAAPTGLTVTDPETSSKLNLAWNASPESDLKNYTVNYGIAPGVYTTTVGVGKLTSFVLQGLSNGTTYYVAITATNTSGHTSSYSQEKFATPTFVRGVKSPAFIADLRLRKNGSDVVLTWGAVTTDIYGKPATVANYEVYRGTTPTFLPALANRIGTPATPTFTDAGALGSGTPGYYLVRAIDVSGNPGGLGNQLPSGPDPLTEAKSGTTPGNIVLSWPAVTRVFDPAGNGAPVKIDHYEIYARSTPFSRANIRDGAVPLLTSVTATSKEITPAAATQYYSVLAVDARGNKSPF